MRPSHAVVAALTLLLLPAAACVPVALASPPNALQSTVPAAIRMVGVNAGSPDSVTGRFAVFVRGISHNPVPRANVVVDLSGCPDLRLASDPLNPNVQVSCAAHQISAYSNDQGEVDLTIVGSSWNAGTYAGAGCARVYADGVLLATPIVSAFDLDGANGVNAADFSILLGDLGSGSYRARSDYNGNGQLSGADLSLWLGALARGGSIVSGATCP